MRVAAAVLLTTAVQIASASAASPAIDETLRGTLLQMASDFEQSVRIATTDPRRPMSADESVMTNILLRRNDDLIRSIVKTHGWPGRRLVGEDGAHAAWVVVHHMDYDLEFQRSCLRLMREAFDAGDVGAQDFAYLTDRVLTADGKPQMYGTQAGVRPEVDEARIDANRFAIGLPPWREAMKKRQEEYAERP
jgi:hypothetical protein